MQVTFGYNFQCYGFVKPASLVSLLISAFLINVTGIISIINTFLYFVARNQKPHLITLTLYA
jgi:hypothetical protein